MSNFYSFTFLQQFPEIFQAVSYRNIENLTDFLNILKIKNYVISAQVHDNKIFKAEFAAGAQELSGYDGFITQAKNLALIVKTADCTPILLYDPVQKAIGAVHAGRKSTILNIATVAVKKMQQDFNSKPKDIFAAIGPAICKNCYQINRDLDLHFDLWQENYNQLLQTGISREHIELSGLCPACKNNNSFFSYRKDQTQKRTYSAIMIL